MKSINIKGKNYVMVNERIMFFRTAEQYKGWSLQSEFIELKEDSCVIKAIVVDDKGIVRATGFAQEDKSSSMINKTSFVENCETSAWGRALGCLGIGINDSIASAEEMQMAISKQEQIVQDEVVGGSFVLKGGKYNGKTIQEVLEKDEAYIRWCIENGQNLTVKLNMQKALVDNGKLDEVEL